MPHFNNISEATKTYYYGNPDLTNRAYTGHEHLIDYQLINMNGRMYDPITKQMTSPDIFDQSSYFTQSYNRYSYAINNPMRYTDPSGYVEIGHRESFVPPPMNSHGANFDDYCNWINLQVAGGYNPMFDNPFYSAIYGSHGGGWVSGVIFDGSNVIISFVSSDKDIQINREFHGATTPMKNIGILGGYYVTFSSHSFKGTDGNWHVKTTAMAYAPVAEKNSDRIQYLGYTRVIVDGKELSRSVFSINSDNSNLIQSDYTFIGDAFNTVPDGVNATLQIVITYNVYQNWNGHAYPIKPYTYLIHY